CGTNANVAYIPTPNSSATRLLVQTTGIRIIRMSMSGCVARCSTWIHTTARTTATRSRPTTREDPQPQSVASLMGSSNATSQADNNIAAIQLTLPRLRTGDSGMTRRVAIAATQSMSVGIQNSQ